MSIKVKKLNTALPLLFLALSQFAFAGSTEQEQFAQLKKAFFQWTQSVYQELSTATSATEEEFRAKLDNFKIELIKIVANLQKIDTQEAQEAANVLAALEKKIEDTLVSAPANWNSFLDSVQNEINVISADINSYGVETQAMLNELSIVFNMTAKDFISKTEVLEQTELKRIEDAFFHWTHEVFQQTHNENHVSDEEFKKQFQDNFKKQWMFFQEVLKKAEVELEKKGTEESLRITAALKSLEKQVESNWDLIHQDWSSFVHSVVVELTPVSERFAKFGEILEKKMEMLANEIDAERTNLNNRMQIAAHAASFDMEMIAAQANIQAQSWGEWVSAYLKEAEKNAQEGIHLFATAAIEDAKKLERQYHLIKSQIETAIENGETESQVIFEEILMHLEEKLEEVATQIIGPL